MQKLKLILIIISILIFIAYFFTKKQDVNAPAFFVKNNTSIYLEIAKTNPEREHGLMERKFMPENHGMVFIFPEPSILRFWMRNTLIPLDMVFLNNNRVVEVFNDVPPCPKETSQCPSYGPKIETDEVIELNAGTAKKLAIQSGDLLTITQSKNHLS
ncbi:MAG: DUF192 domain-containing protein [Gammaproteobacteria bacterium]|nr:DUF192 domain-containing protein [Gammaproteobacteria bacterium]